MPIRTTDPRHPSTFPPRLRPVAYFARVIGVPESTLRAHLRRRRGDVVLIDGRQWVRVTRAYLELEDILREEGWLPKGRQHPVPRAGFWHELLRDRELDRDKLKRFVAAGLARRSDRS